MKIASIINSADSVDVAIDTLESVRYHIGGEVMLMVDGLHYDKYSGIDCTVLKGYCLGGPSPFRNIVLALLESARIWPDVDWYMHCDYDALICSDWFKSDLAAVGEDVWMLGSDAHSDDKAMPLVSHILGETITDSHYILEACMFLRGDFVRECVADGFFNRFLEFTAQLPVCCFPFYNGPDVCEHMLPSLCVHKGGRVISLSKCDADGNWSGDYLHYPVRWRPEVEGEQRAASILHPDKSCCHPARQYHKNRRKNA